MDHAKGFASSSSSSSGGSGGADKDAAAAAAAAESSREGEQEEEEDEEAQEAMAEAFERLTQAAFEMVQQGKPMEAEYVLTEGGWVEAACGCAAGVCSSST